MADRPRLLPFVKEATPEFRADRIGFRATLSTGVAGHVFKFALQSCFGPPRIPLFTSTHLAPSFCEPGRISHQKNCGLRISDCGFENQNKRPGVADFHFA
jgi:hypothetical protein